MSETTKNKLSRFQYRPAQQDGATDGAATDTDSPAHAAADHGTTATPRTRLDWRDLVEPSATGSDDADTSPKDKLLWNNKQDPAYTDFLSPVMGRKRKRARSSSPLSSPSAAAAPNTPTVNVQGLSNALRLPHADPTLELWDRYALGQHDDAGSGAANPALAQLMLSSSPKPSRSTAPRRAEGALRRAASCGLGWAKRTRVDKPRLGSQGSDEQRELEAASKSSLVNALLDTVSSSFHFPDQQERGPPVETPSPPRRRRPGPTTAASPCQAVAGRDPHPPSSDYGDDDFDDDTFMEIEAAMSRGAPKAMAANTVQDASPRVGAKSTAAAGSADDFDDDDDVFAADEPLPAGARQARPQMTTAAAAAAASTPRTNPRTRARPLASPGDDFGDDFDGDIDFDAVELAATQTLQQRKMPSAAVGRSAAARARFPIC